MELRLYELPPIGTNAYLLFDRERGEAALFDAPMGAAEKIGEFLKTESLRLTGLYLTHGHWDHTLDAAEVRAMEVPVFCHPDDRTLVEDPGQMAEFLLPGLGIEPTEVDKELVEGQTLEILGQEVRVSHVPGHSAGSVSFYFPALATAISGDVIFKGGVGRTDLPGGSFEVLEASIREKIYTLPEDTTLYPGHGSATTVKAEREANPFVHD